MNKENMDVLKDKINFARKTGLRAGKAVREVFYMLDRMGIDLSLPTNAENADNLEDAILCYIQYGEYDLENIMREIQDASEGEKK